MDTFTNSEDPDEMPHKVAFHEGLHFAKVKKIVRLKIQFFFINYNLTLLDMYNGPEPKFFVSNQKDESISIQRVYKHKNWRWRIWL